MKADNRYTQMDDSQIAEKTGRKSAEWYKIMDDFGGQTKKGSEVTKHLVDNYELNKFWARTLYIRYQWERNLRTE